MKQIRNKTGLKYGKLTVLSTKKKIGTRWHWECQCECGIVRFIDTCKLHFSKSGQKSCGCSQHPIGDDLTGQKFGRLRVLKFSHLDRKQRNSIWFCECDCGNKLVLSTPTLRRKNRPTRSCGCIRPEAVARSENAYNRKEPGESNCNGLFSSYKRTARGRKHSFNIPRDVFQALTSQNCHYCNLPPKQIFNLMETNGAYIYNGLDRKDGTVGYEIENVVTCCKTCNYAKRIMGYEEFLKWVETVYNHRVKNS